MTTSRIVVLTDEYWHKINEYYYTMIETGEDGDDVELRPSIWEWLELEYNAIRYYPWQQPRRVIFETDAEVTLFKLRWL